MVNRSKVEASKSTAGAKSPSKSATRDKSSSRTARKSPSRSETVTSVEVASKSLSHTPSRRSPIRKSPSRKSPARKSPSRKSPTRSSPPARRSTSRGRPPKSAKVTKKVIDLDSDSGGDELDPVNTEKPKATVRGRARKLESEYSLPKVILQDIHSSVVQEVSNFGVVLRSSTKSQSNDIERIVHLKNDIAAKKLSEFSDEDELPLKRRGNSVREQSEGLGDLKLKELNISTEAGSWIGALISILFVPLSFIILYGFCNETHCKFTSLPNLNKYKNFSSWFDFTALLMYLGYISLVAILSALPIGGPKVSGLPNKQGKLNYVMNGFFIAAVTSTLLVTLEYYKVPVISHIIDKYFQLIVTATIVGILISIYLYIRSFYVPISALNPYAISNNKIYNFWIGREINPRIFGKLDIKILLFRTFIITMLLLNAIFVYKSIQFTAPVEVQNYNLKGVKYNPTLLVIGALQIFYVIDILIFETAMVTTFDVQYEALGYMSTVSMLAGSFITPLMTKYIYDYHIKLPIWHLSAAVVLYLIGYVLYRGSNNQKNAFRQNPYSPAVSHLESIPTSQGKKLLVSGYWGFVRHPNYLGDILMFLSFASFVWNSPAVLICVIDILFLIQRSHRDGKRCKERYGSAWNRYCQRVKYVLVPKIY